MTWSRLESEPPFGNEFLENNQTPNSVNIRNLTISATKSQVILRVVPLSSLILSGGIQTEEDASLNIDIYFQIKPMLSTIMNFVTLNYT
jgi:hypothetical protein